MSIFIVVLTIIILIFKNEQYKKGSYYKITKNSYLAIRFDKGKYGEYLTYKSLKYFENTGGKLLFNLYIPKGEYKTTEIDALLICPKGLFVVESKNYSGWIFGNEIQRNWTQIIYNHKKRFYNPIMQNKSHIKCLKNLVGQNIPMFSVIVFSDRCTLKDITIKNDAIRVINQHNLKAFITRICNNIQQNLLTEMEINDIYNTLYPYTQVSCEEKIHHKEKILSNYKN